MRLFIRIILILALGYLGDIIGSIIGHIVSILAQFFLLIPLSALSALISVILTFEMPGFTRWVIHDMPKIIQITFELIGIIIGIIAAFLLVPPEDL